MIVHRYVCMCVRAEWTVINSSTNNNQEAFFQKEEQKEKKLCIFHNQ